MGQTSFSIVDLKIKCQDLYSLCIPSETFGSSKFSPGQKLTRPIGAYVFEYVVGRKTKSKPICVLKGDLISAIYGDQEKGTGYVMSPTTI